MLKNGVTMVKKVLRVVLIALIVVVSLPVVWIMQCIGYEIFGYFANHSATDKQTKELKTVIQREIEDVRITDVYSWTGNTTGTSNHVDCLSKITFSSNKDYDYISGIILKYCEDCSNGREVFDVTIDYENGIYTVKQISQAPFPNNIEGH